MGLAGKGREVTVAVICSDVWKDPTEKERGTVYLCKGPEAGVQSGGRKLHA